MRAARSLGRALVRAALGCFLGAAGVSCGESSGGDDSGGDDAHSGGSSGTAGSAGSGGGAGAPTGGTGGTSGATLSACFPVDPKLTCTLICQAESATCVTECSPLGSFLHDTILYDGLASCEADSPALLGVGSCDDTSFALLLGLTYMRCCCG